MYICIHTCIHMYTVMCVVGWWCMQSLLFEVLVQSKRELHVRLLECSHPINFLIYFGSELLQAWLTFNCHLKLELQRLQLIIALLPLTPLLPVESACMHIKLSGGDFRS